MYQPFSNSFASNARHNGFLCGDFLEITWRTEGTPKGFGKEKPVGSGKEPETQEQIRARSAARSRRTVRRLCNTNKLYYMHTLTYAIKHIDYFQGEKPFKLIPLDDQKDRDKVILHWERFVRKLRQQERAKGRYFRYIAVIEKHSGKRSNDNTVKTGTYHVHFVSDKLFHKRKLQGLWQHGLCNHSDWTKGRKKNDLDNTDTQPPPDNPGAYLSKYIGKDSEATGENKKRYWASKNLEKPVPMAGEELRALACEGKTIYHKPEYFSKGSEDNDPVVVRQSWTILLTHKGGDNRAKQPKDKRLEKRSVQYKHTKQLERLQHEKLYRRTGKTIANRAIERRRFLKQQTRAFNEAFEMERYRTATPDNIRRARTTGRKLTTYKKALGSNRAEQIFRRKRESKRTFQSYATTERD